MKRTKIVKLLQSEIPATHVLIKGWVRTRRDSKGFSFIEVNDGSCLKNIQILTHSSLSNYPDILRLSTGSAVIISGNLVESMGSGQKWEILADRVEIVSFTPESYTPCRKKRHYGRVF